MLFSTSTFILIFLPVVLFMYYIVIGKNNIARKNIFLLLASLFFYAWGEPRFVIIMVASILINWGLGILIDKYRNSKTKSRLIIVLTLLINLGILGVFKYLTFIISNIERFIDLPINIPEIALPIGISFFTFQAISYVIDIYRQKGRVQKNPLNLGLYISFFPQLIAGPIVRYETVSEQINNRQETFDKFSKGVCRFIIGLGKKVLLSNALAMVVDKAFGLAPGELSVAFAWLGAISYMLQIYFDFSGYSDMAIGLGKMFGFDFPENFDYPYTSKTITEFWRRWHISLGTWFRDYVYIPLGGSRVSTKRRLIFNLFVVWLLTGIWHGASWTFVLWGLYYFVLLSIEKLLGLDKKEIKNKFVNFFRHITTLLLVLLGWVMFRAEGIRAAYGYFRDMIGINNNHLWDGNFILYFKEYIVYIILAIICCLPYKKLSEKKAFSIFYVIALVFTLIVSMSYIIKGTYNPFIYFNF